MKLTTDKIGFPLVLIEKVGAFNLWPVTKTQFERYLSEPTDLGDSWYEAVLKLNPRVSYLHPRRENYEGLIITGLLPEEALKFARWLGEGFDLPSLEEWRDLYQQAKEWQVPAAPPDGLSEAASKIWSAMAELAQAPRDFSMLEGGVLEWVRDNGSFAGLGAPRPGFLKNAWNPLLDKLRPLGKTRLPYFGFRLIKRDGYAAGYL